MLRPAIGMALYLMAAAFGWIVHPVLALFVFVFVVGYYAWTSQGSVIAGRSYHTSQGERRFVEAQED